LQRPATEVEALIREVQSSRVAAEAARAGAEERLQVLESERGELRAARDELERRTEMVDVDAEGALEERLRAAMPLLERARGLLPQVPPAARAPLEELLEELALHLEGAQMGPRREAFLAQLREGHQVFVPRLGRRLMVTRVDRRRRLVKVRLGRQVLSVDFDELSAFESL